MRQVMQLAWQFVKQNGYDMSGALRCAWLNIKLKAKLQNEICQFYFQKVNGELRQAFGTLQGSITPAVENKRTSSPLVQTYFDTEKNEWRCFKKCNLIKII